MVKHNSSYPTPFKFFSWNLNCQQKLHDYTNLVNLTVVSNWTFEWLVFVTWQVLWCVWFRIDFPVLLVTFVVWKRVRECVGDSRYTWYKTGSPPMTAGYFCWQWTVAANTHTYTHSQRTHVKRGIRYSDNSLKNKAGSHRPLRLRRSRRLLRARDTVQ